MLEAGMQMTTLTVPPHRNSMPRAQDMTSQPVISYRYTIQVRPVLALSVDDERKAGSHDYMFKTDRQSVRQTDRSVYLTKIKKIHNDNIYNNCGRETSNKTTHSRSRGGNPDTFHNS